MTRQEFIRRKRTYLRRYPAPKLPSEGCMWGNMGREISISYVESLNKGEMDRYDALPKEERDYYKYSLRNWCSVR